MRFNSLTSDPVISYNNQKYKFIYLLDWIRLKEREREREIESNNKHSSLFSLIHSSIYHEKLGNLCYPPSEI